MTQRQIVITCDLDDLAPGYARALKRKLRQIARAGRLSDLHWVRRIAMRYQKIPTGCYYFAFGRYYRAFFILTEDAVKVLHITHRQHAYRKL